ncbi:unnamed protein product [Ixodes persulcatus]
MDKFGRHHTHTCFIYVYIYTFFFLVGIALQSGKGVVGWKAKCTKPGKKMAKELGYVLAMYTASKGWCTHTHSIATECDAQSCAPSRENTTRLKSLEDGTQVVEGRFW